MRRSIGFILKSLLVSMLVSMALILAASTASAYTPNDPYWGSQWGPNKIYAPDAWNYQKGSTTITVAILDTGIDYNHEDLSGRVIQGWNFYNNSNAVMDDNSDSHGTRIAGISGAVMDNNTGIAGIAQTNLLAVKVCNFMQNCTWPAITDGIYYAANNGAKIISMSLQKDEYSSNAETAVDYAYNNKGALLVGISGNGFYGTGENIIKYPGNFSQVIAVGATDSNDQRASFSNYGSKLELVAPGDNIFSTTRNNGYAGDVGDRKNGSGTSYAAPHVAGVAALVWSQYPTLSNSEVRQILTSTAVDLGDAGRDIYYGYGRVNASAAVTSNMLSSWRYNRRLTITGSTSGSQTNYQMKLKVYNSTGTDTPGNIYLGGNAKSDFSDLRFTKSDGTTLLDYWIESYTSGVSAVVWVEVDSIPASPNTATIYLYYGNAAAVTISSGTNTFEFFDDFLGNSIDTSKWSIFGGIERVTVSNSIVTITAPYGSWSGMNGQTFLAPPHAFRGRVKFAQPGSVRNGFGANNYHDTHYIYFDTEIDSSPQRLRSDNACRSSSSWTYSAYSIFEVRWTSTKAGYFENDVEKTGSPVTGSCIPTDNLGVHFETWNAPISSDWVLIRKYADPEPAWGS